MKEIQTRKRKASGDLQPSGSAKVPFIDTENSKEHHLDCVKTEPEEETTVETSGADSGFGNVAIKQEVEDDEPVAVAVAATNGATSASPTLLRAKPISTLTRDAAVVVNSTAPSGAIAGLTELKVGSKVAVGPRSYMKTQDGKIIIFSAAAAQKNLVLNPKSAVGGVATATPPRDTVVYTSTSLNGSASAGSPIVLQANPTKICLDSSPNVINIRASAATSPDAAKTTAADITVVTAGDSSPTSTKAAATSIASVPVTRSTIASPIVVKKAVTSLAGRTIIAGGGLKLVAPRRNDPAPQERLSPKLRLKFINQPDVEPHLKVKHQHSLQLSEQPVSGTFDVIVRRKNYKTFPIQWKHESSSAGARCPFVITAPGNVRYGPIAVPKGGDVVHQGATITLENTDEIMISFMMISTYLTNDEREKNIKMHTAKHFEMLFLHPETGRILDSIMFQVVCEPRLGQKLKKQVRPPSLSSPAAARSGDDGGAAGSNDDEEDMDPEERKKKLIDDLIDTLKTRGPELPLPLLTSFRSIMELIPNKSD